MVDFECLLTCSSKILLDLKRLAESADKAKLPEASPPE